MTNKLYRKIIEVENVKEVGIHKDLNEQINKGIFLTNNIIVYKGIFEIDTVEIIYLITTNFNGNYLIDYIINY